MQEATNYIILQLNNGAKVVPLQQAEAIRKERDSLLIANKNLTTLLDLYRRCGNVATGTK